MEVIFLKVNEFTREQVIYLTFIAACGNMAYNSTWCVAISGRSSFVAVFIGTLLMIPVSFLILKVCKKHESCTLFDIIELGFGKFITGIFVIIYSLIVIIIAVSTMLLFTGQISTSFLQLTPPWLIMLIILFISSLIVSKGVNILGRMVEILAIWAICNYFPVFFLSLFKQFNWEYVIPIFDTSFFSFIKGTLFSFGSASEFLIFELIITAYIKEPYKHRKWITRGIFLWAFVIILAVFLIIGIKNVEIFEGMPQVGVEAARAINLGDFIRGVEVFIVMTYQIIAISKIAICIFCIKGATKKTFSFKYSKTFIVLIASIIFIISFEITNVNTVYFLSLFCAIYLTVPFTLLVILFAFFSNLINKKKVKNTT